LSELAQALGNDPNFATTITNMIGSKTTLSAVQANNEQEQIHLTRHCQHPF
jgi:hypothetical protein